MNIPGLVETQFVNKDGYLTDDAKNFFSALLISLQYVLSDEGIKLPQQSATNIADLNTTESMGAILYDSTNNLAKVNIAGVFKTILTS